MGIDNVEALIGSGEEDKIQECMNTFGFNREQAIHFLKNKAKKNAS